MRDLTEVECPAYRNGPLDGCSNQRKLLPRESPPIEGFAMGKIANFIGFAALPAVVGVLLTMTPTTSAEYEALRAGLCVAGISSCAVVAQAIRREANTLGHYILGYVVLATIIAVVFPGLWMWINAKEIASHQLPRFQVAFSATQNIKLWAPSLGGNETLNLDNVAVLRVIGAASSSQITLSLDTVPTRTQGHGDSWKIEIRRRPISGTRSFEAISV